MKKSFKRSIAVLLSVLMVAVSLPFTALAADGKYAPDIQLQFGAFWSASAGSPFAEYEDYDDLSYTGIYGPVVDYDNGVLTIDADKYNTWAALYGMDSADSNYTLTTGDKFTLTVRLDKVTDISAFEAAITYSDNIAPYYNDDWSIEGNIPFDPTGAESLYEGLNDDALGNLSFVDEDKNVIVASAYANGADKADVSATSVTGLTNPATGETDYDYANKAVIATFVFEIVNDGPISFGIYKTGTDEDVTYGGAYYIAEGTDAEDAVTYEPEATAEGSTDMTFMSKNEYVAPTGVTITFKNADGSVISETTYDEGATVTVPSLPTAKHDTAKHYTYAWDAEPQTTATTDATYTVVETAAEHANYTSEVYEQPTCQKKGTTEYTCGGCDFSFRAQDIAKTAHTAGTAVRENVVDSTCAKTGSYDEVVYCTACTTEMSRTQKTIEKKAHSYGAYVFNEDAQREVDGTETRTCGSCGATDTRTATGTGSLRATSYNLTLSAGIAVNFKTNNTTIAKFDKVWCEVSKYDATKKKYEKTVIEDGELDGTRTQYVFTKIAPQCMADNMIVYFYAERDGVVYHGIPYETTVRTYVMNQLNKETKKNATSTLYVDMFKYGVAAQNYMNYNKTDYADALLSATQNSWASAPIAEYTDSQNSTYVVCANPKAKWRTAALVLESSVDFKLSFSDPNNGTTLTDISNLKVKVQLENGQVKWFSPQETPECFTPYGTTGRWYFQSKDIAVADLVSPVYFTICDKDGNAISNTFRYSAESFTMRQSGTTEKDRLRVLLNSMQVYAKSAYNYTLK